MYCGFKILMLLSNPFPLRPSYAIRFARHSRLPLEALSPAAASHGRLLSLVPSSKLGFSIRAAEQVQTHEVVKEEDSGIVTSIHRFKESHSWPEWSKLADHLMSKGYSQRPVVLSDEDDSFSTDGDLSEEFSRSAEACLNFARERPDVLRLLSRKYIETVVENGSPYLFKNGEKSVSRLRAFLVGNGSNEIEPDKGQTVDIMRYLLSYMHKSFSTSSTSNGNQFKADESVETSVRKLLLELFNLSGTLWRSKLPEPTTTEPPFRNEHLSRPQVRSFEMKRGDWICQKCTFQNFARNMSCLECGESRPKRQLTGAEWECPQCDFFNYGRNSSCLRCDCKRPADSLPSPGPVGGLELSQSNAFLQDSPKSSSVRLQSDNTSDSISRSLDRILARNLSTTGENDTSHLVNSSQIGRSIAKQRRKPDVAPFVPLPPDMFRKTPESNNDLQQSSDKGIASSSPSTNDLIDSLLKSTESSMKSNDNKESSDASLRLSRTAAEPSYSSAVPDNDFPDIMPIRKGENRFVVSKKKDRSLTSPSYKRRLAMEQANSYNSIPFVPFPPDYFAKKDNQPAIDSTESTRLAEAETLPEKQGEHNLGLFDQLSAQKLAPSSNRNDLNSSNPNSAVNSPLSANSSRNRNIDGEVEVDSYHGSSYHSTQPDGNSRKHTGYYSNTYGEFSANSSQSPNTSSSNYNSSSTQSSHSGFTANSSQPSVNKLNDSTSLAAPRSRSDGSSSWSRGITANNSSVGSPRSARKIQTDGFSGKSLEGSCVKETDPLDMSEEAKAERWFRRAAQIKDISELSQIPDEDFPEIMPMRKGVNRFVVSKRKTPLERRLTSPQYRKNLPVVSSEPEKDSSN